MGADAERSTRARAHPVASIIVPVYGAGGLLTALLAALARNTPERYELVLIDNGTGITDDIEPPWIRIVRNQRNLGFARACNQGAEVATSDRLVLLNVDTEPEPAWLPPLLHALDLPGVGIVGARLVYPDGRLQHAGVDVWHGALTMPSNRQTERDAEDVDAVTGACLAITRECWDACGGLDEAYVNGGEDVDLCLTAKRLGYRVRYEPASVVVHHESATGPERWSHLAQNLRRLAEKWPSSQS